jgi:formate-dependent phosphoribosylglycinamide formyltransferase (GAR transformylase)
LHSFGLNLKFAPLFKLKIMVEIGTLFMQTAKTLAQPDTQIRLFGKPEVHGHRRMRVWLARGTSVEEAREKTGKAMAALNIKL